MTRFQEELAQAAAPPGLAAAGPALWPFAGYYQGFARLPRKARRALQRRWRRSLGKAGAPLLALGQAPALAATINVGGGCTLVDAITAANNDAPAGGCTAGSGPDTLVLPAGSTHTLTAVNNSTYGPNGLPAVTSAITIDGNGSTITRDPGTPQFRILEVARSGNLTLEETTISGGVTYLGGGGVNNYEGTLTLSNSTVSGNSAGSGGGGVRNLGVLTLSNSTVSGNTGYGGGVSSIGTVTLTNSTVSGNSAGGPGGGLDVAGTLTLTNSTVSSNSTAGAGGGVFNRIGSTLALIQTVVSGNTASAQGPEVYNYPGTYAAGTVIANNLNLFGHDGVAGVAGFTPGPTDLVPSAPLAAILNPTLGDNGGLTRTHALVAGSPAADAVTAASCATASDQRGFVRPQDSNADTVADCDIGAFELALPAVETVAADPNPQSRCTRSRYDILIKCNVDPGLGTLCTNQIRFFVRERDVRLSERTSTKAPRRIRFAAGVTNIPPAGTANVRLKLTKQGKKIVRTSKRRSLRGVMEIRNSAGTVSSTRIRIRLR